MKAKNIFPGLRKIEIDELWVTVSGTRTNQPFLKFTKLTEEFFQEYLLLFT